MKRFVLVICVLVLVTAPVTAAVMSRGETDATGGDSRATTCGNAFYDDGTGVNAAYFGGGHAGDPDFMFGVLFNLADFGFTPGAVEIVAFCAGNDMGYSGGPWNNVVFIYPDNGGTPNDGTVLGQGTISTGDGTGQDEITLASPVTLSGDFWLMNRGDASVGATDFNMEFDAGPATGHSYASNSGIAGLTVHDDRNYVLRATLQEAAGPTPTPPPGGGGGEPIPTMNHYGMLAMIALLAGVAILVVVRKK